MGVARRGYGVSGRAAHYDRRKPGTPRPAEHCDTAEEKAQKAYNSLVRDTYMPVPAEYARIALAMRLPSERIVTSREDVRYYLLPAHQKVIAAFDNVFWNLSEKGRDTIARRVRKRIEAILAAQALGAPEETVAQMIRQAWRHG